MVADVPFRIFEYASLLALALAAETPAEQAVPRIRSTLVLLSGREKPWPAEGEYRISPDGAAFSGVRFRIDAVHQRTVAELAARGSPPWMIFAPLAVDADPDKMKEVLDRLRTETSGRAFREIAVAMTVVADKDKRQRDLRGAIIEMLDKEIVMESWVFTQGKLKSEQEGELKVLARLGDKRLGRSLTEGEHAILARRLGSLGHDRVLDTEHDLPPEALAAWLGDPSAN
jgi:hypothetical protein